MNSIIKKYNPKETMEGAGVLVNRVFGYYQVPDFDPFLMLDYFHTDSSEKSPGFPWHPHKGIETITYMLRGSIMHEDSLGHKGIIGAGDVQWMTAGGGIYHQEMPQSAEGGYKGFQFWLNMPAKDKLNPPKYQEYVSGQLSKTEKDGVKIIVISGKYEEIRGPIDKTELGVRLMHVKIPHGKEITLERKQNKSGYIFVFEGSGTVNEEQIESTAAYTLESGQMHFKAEEQQLEFIFAEGKPIYEAIAWYGPMVMNTNEEIQKALNDLRNGRFAK